MSAQDNAATVRAVEEAWDSNDLDSLDQYFAEDFDNTGAGVPGVPPGLAAAKMVHQGAMTSFPDRKVEIVDLIADDDQVAVHGRVTGTNQGGSSCSAPGRTATRSTCITWASTRCGTGRS